LVTIDFLTFSGVNYEGVVRRDAAINFLNIRKKTTVTKMMLKKFTAPRKALAK
jgi:hypothetical protein